jgi:putative phage-type endonuclease
LRYSKSINQTDDKKSEIPQPKLRDPQAPKKGNNPMPKNKNNTLPDELGSATRVGNFENQSPEWHELRATGIGGSDIAAICRTSPWTSPFALWAKKTGRIEDTVGGSEAAEWGTILEPVILDQFEQRSGLKLYRDVGTWANKERPWQLANPDAIYQDGDKFGIVEVKTSRYEDDWTNGVPVYYRTQVQWYAQTFGFDTTIYVVALFGGSKYRVFELAADQFEMETNLAEVEKFRIYLDTDTQPDFDGALSTYETVRALHPEIEPGEEVELGDLWVHTSNALEDEKKASAKALEMKSRVLDSLGKAKKGTYEGDVVVTRTSRNGGTPYLQIKKGA